MPSESTVLIVDNQHLSDAKKIIRERIIPWEGLSRADVISEDDANHIKILEKQSLDNKYSTILSQLQLYSNTLLNVLNKLNVNSKDDVLKNVLNLINDLLIDLPKQEFLDTLLDLSKVDDSLPYYPFLKHLDNNDTLIKTLSLYNLTILLTKKGKTDPHAKIDKEILIRIFDLLSSDSFIGNPQDINMQIVGIQLLQELLLVKNFKEIYQGHNLISNFKPINNLIARLSRQPNNSSLQLVYNVLLTAWILSFSASINRSLVHNYPELIGSLLIMAKDSIKSKIVRVSVAILKNFVTITTSNSEQFKIIKLVLFHDGLSTVGTLKERKFASNGSDEELSNDLSDLSDSLNEIVKEKLTSLDEYLTELENPNLISWSSPTHKSQQFWEENAPKFKENSFKLVKKMLDILSSKPDKALSTIIILNDLQFLIQNLGQDLIDFINTENGGQYKLLIMGFLGDSNGNTELKYEALKTVQLLVGQHF
ncbi:uncharacterized protein PRCAT00005693001 [Priceomyces carsonii]|uniref:uncharacterized protein n=1 Tax=Priceomyces carsonii TaxID=28549 RepID=UPI002EDA2AF7|nr:unnamed protein product [Priceomyces carsonii]